MSKDSTLSNSELLKMARELSLKKWKYICEHGGSEVGLIEAIPELEELAAECAYCEIFDNRLLLSIARKSAAVGTLHRGCFDCPVRKVTGMNCHEDESVFQRWWELELKTCDSKSDILSENNTEKRRLAGEMLDIIKRAPDLENTEGMLEEMDPSYGE